MRPALACIAILAAFGCDNTPPLPKTYSATGTVFKGKQPMKGGSIRFAVPNDPLMHVTGEIGADGTFTLRTVKDHQRKDGAPEGEFTVTVQPPAVEAKSGGGQGKHVEPIVLSNKYKVEATDNTFKIELP